MTNKEQFEFFVDQLIENAGKEFRETEQYELLREKLDQMDEDCEGMFAKDEKDFAEECFELILTVEGEEKEFVYRKGLLDSVKILKCLGAI